MSFFNNSCLFKPIMSTKLHYETIHTKLVVRVIVLKFFSATVRCDQEEMQIPISRGKKKKKIRNI